MVADSFSEVIDPTSFQVIIDISSTTFEANFNSNSAQRTIALLPEDRGTDFPECHSSGLYEYARLVAEIFELKRIVNIGWNRDVSGREHFEKGSYQFHSICHCRKGKDEAGPVEPTYHTCNLQFYQSIEPVLAPFNDNTPTLYILNDILGSIADPRPLLRTLRILLQKNPVNRCIISTPDRQKALPGLQLPSNPAHFREWTLEELCSFIGSCGFQIERQGYDCSESTDSVKKSGVLEITCSHEYHLSFLENNGFPGESPHLIITSEHRDSFARGDIGSYVEAIESLAREKPIVLFIGNTGMSHSSFLKERKWLSPEFLLRKRDFQDEGDLVLEATKQILFFYERIKLIEYQDSRGFAYRVAQAKKAGFFPLDTITKVTCHGVLSLIEHGCETWLPFSEVHILYKEKEALEKADMVTFPTGYIKESYKDMGYEYDEKKCEIWRNPYIFNPLEESLDFSPLHTLIFYGNRTRAKGFPEFAGALKLLKEENIIGSMIKKIVLIGPSSSECREENSFIKNLRKSVSVEECVISRTDAIIRIASLRMDGLCICPYKADNHPYSLLDVIDGSCQLLTSNTGGSAGNDTRRISFIRAHHSQCPISCPGNRWITQPVW